MNPLLPHPKRSSRRACGLLLLALPLGGLALPPLARAQEAPAPAEPAPAKEVSSHLTAEQQALIDKFFALAEREDMCKPRVDVKVDNASLDDVLAALRDAMPGQPLAVEVRGAQPISESFDVQYVMAGDVLEHVASQAKCEFWVLPGGLLIAPFSKLTDDERADLKRAHGGRWKESGAATPTVPTQGGFGRTYAWSTERAAKALFTYAVALDIHGGPFKGAIPEAVRIKAGALSPASRKMLQRILDWNQEDDVKTVPHAVAIQLVPDVPIRLYLSEPDKIIIGVAPDASQPQATTIQFGASRP